MGTHRKLRAGVMNLRPASFFSIIIFLDDLRKTSEFKRDLAYAELWNFNRIRWFVDSERMRRILNTIQETRTVSQFFRLRRHESDQTVIHRASQMHRQILDALIANDSIAASQRMAAHIRASQEGTLNYLAKEQQRNASNLTSICELPDEVRSELMRIENEDLDADER